jgi:hypothetical protein
VFHSRGVVFPAWTLATFAIGACCGMLFRRTVPAMAVTMGAYAALYIVAWQYLMRWYPVSRFWAAQFVEAGWLLVLSVLLTAATVWLARRRAA